MFAFQLCRAITVASFFYHAGGSPENGKILKNDNANPLLDITKVLNTEEFLWLYMQTTPTTSTETFGIAVFNITQTCIYNVKDNITSSVYNFTQNMKLNGEPISNKYTGVFFPNPTGKAPVSMLVLDPKEDTDKKDGQTEGNDIETESRNDETLSEEEILRKSKNAFQMTTIKYTDPENSSCSVFFVTTLDDPELSKTFPVCEMYIMNTDIERGPSSGCLEYYKKECGQGREYKPYDSSCRKTSSPDGNIVENK